jgi:hypothetical protein
MPTVTGITVTGRLTATSGTTGLDQIFQLERAVDVANALNGTMYYLTNARVIAALKQLKSAQADYIAVTVILAPSPLKLRGPAAEQ